MVTLKLRITPAVTSDGIVVSLMPNTKLLPLQAVFPHPVRPLSQPFHPADLFFRIIEGDSRKVRFSLLGVQIFQLYRLPCTEGPFNLQLTFTLISGLYHIGIFNGLMAKLLQTSLQPGQYR